MTLKPEQIEKFRKTLLTLQAELTHHVEGASEEVKKTDEGKGYSQHQADEGTDDFDRMVSLSISSNEMDVLRQIERALEKIDEGTFGTCDVSNQPIPIKRLEVIPYATTTVEAQASLEKGSR